MGAEASFFEARLYLSTIKPRQEDQHRIHPVLIDEKKCTFTVLYGAAKASS
jgi:hypothetical protein